MPGGSHMTESKAKKRGKTLKADKNTFSETDEFNHERNQVSKAQKQMASQETAGVLEPE
jgi:hypothetical protein